MKSGNQSMYMVLIPAVYWPADEESKSMSFPNVGEDFLFIWGFVDGIHIYTMNKPSTAKKILGSISAIRSVLTNESNIS